ncbi:helix-turn-helix domain-containing protein [Streptomyces demainii]|uniref:Excisionase family DNA binding protein n=1 Tax=Streptomyces demainii TaxID=588122 RepID=A0ABT9KK99_9ACTN|nr:helix-turn-helix domain-containing protein [Streptomyces demainii]MDP9608850.1 excisionase family DNA binding protein [Streptomyces demainii]
MTLAIPEDDARLLYCVPDAMKFLSIKSKDTIYALMRTGRLRSVKEGRARKIPASALHEYVALLEREAGEQQ